MKQEANKIIPPIIEIDEEADATYIKFNDKEVDQTISLGDNLNVDYDKEGLPIGVELLSMVHHIIPQD
jgi:uncharacterized protein YuzE